LLDIIRMRITGRVLTVTVRANLGFHEGRAPDDTKIAPGHDTNFLHCRVVQFGLGSYLSQYQCIVHAYYSPHSVHLSWGFV
jgi:hypothetical protein